MKRLFLSLMTVIFFIYGCSESKSRKEYPCGFLGLGRVGHPDLVMGNIVNRINNIYKEKGIFPNAEIIFHMLPSDKMFIYYSFADNNYQLAYWSGETTWIYNFDTDSYYETEKDMIREKWFPIQKKIINTDKINYNHLALRNRSNQFKRKRKTQ